MKFNKSEGSALAGLMAFAPFFVSGVIVSGVIVGVGVSTPSVAHAATQVFVNDCGTPSIKPDSLTQFCADAGVSVIHIHWSSWSAKGAAGSGTLAINSCDPYCAAGKYSYTPVRIELSGLKVLDGKSYLRNVVLTVLRGAKLNIPKNMRSVPGGLRWVESGQ